MRAALVVACVSGFSCVSVVPFGADVDGGADTECMGLSVNTCPSTPWRAAAALTTTDELKRAVLGRWRFCGGQSRYRWRGSLLYCPGAEPHVEFFEESGGLRFRYLPHSEDPWDRGSVRLEIEDGHALMFLLADDRIEARWDVKVFGSPRVLQNSAYDEWNFVPYE